MLKLIMSMFIFCIVLFLYLHIHFHLKTSNDLEIFEVEQVSKDRLEEICDLRQPILFDLEPEHVKIANIANKKYITEQYPIFEVKIRDSANTMDSAINSVIDSETELYVPLPLHVATKLFHEDKKGIYYSENNFDFITETGILKTIQQYDHYLRPPLISNTNYDIILGSEGATTPFRYQLNYRNYFMVTQGSVEIKLTPPKNSKYLYPVNDYENFEFKSPINPWNVQARYKNDFDKIKCLKLTLHAGKCFYIPAYWWYSFQFHNDASISCFYYKTYMNNVSMLPQFVLYFLQNQNVKRKLAKHIELANANADMNADHDTDNHKKYLGNEIINGPDTNKIKDTSIQTTNISELN